MSHLREQVRRSKYELLTIRKAVTPQLLRSPEVQHVQYSAPVHTLCPSLCRVVQAVAKTYHTMQDQEASQRRMEEERKVLEGVPAGSQEPISGDVQPLSEAAHDDTETAQGGELEAKAEAATPSREEASVLRKEASALTELLHVRLKLDSTLEDYSACEGSVLEELAQGLGLPVEQLSVLSVVAGSVALTVVVALEPHLLQKVAAAAAAVAGKSLGGLKVLDVAAGSLEDIQQATEAEEVSTG